MCDLHYDILNKNHNLSKNLMIYALGIFSVIEFIILLIYIIRSYFALNVRIIQEMLKRTLTILNHFDHKNLLQ